MELDVLLPFHRVDRFFDEALRSLAESEKITLNVILIDDRLDKSRDIEKSVSVLKNYSIVRTAGGTGYGNALFLGTQNLKSDAVALFNSDDLVHPLRFRKQIDSLENCELVMTNMQRIDEHEYRIPNLTGNMNSFEYDPLFLIFGSYGANASWCMRTDWWAKNAFFDNEACLDWRIALKTFVNTKINYLPENLYSYRKHANQITNRKPLLKLDMPPTYSLWSNLMEYYGFESYSIETFGIFGAPWIKTIKIEPMEISNFVKEIYTFSSHFKPNIEANIKQLIQRRLLFALRSQSNSSFKLWLALNGMKQIPYVGKELVLAQFINHFID